eukprot:TRINITY_DN5777_c0_g2_i1.p1 TRINITY_DN5777_c0_g2~~TRINITY_DN5777_c0_g2_i1.p1  ORF type:complete len:664 (-),score=21.91 TRINITY_DN5777_c0_g2_i1:1210-3099(-)
MSKNTVVQSQLQHQIGKRQTLTHKNFKPRGLVSKYWFKCSLLVLVPLSLIYLIVRLNSSRNSSSTYNDDYQFGAQSYPILVQACNGYANQRISIVFAVLAGIIAQRDVLLPQLPLNGEQRGGVGNIHSGNTEDVLLFSEVYDLGRLQKKVSKYDIRLAEQSRPLGEDVFKTECVEQNVLECLASIQNVNQTVDLGCGFPSRVISSAMVLDLQPILDDILLSLVPSKKYQKTIDDISRKLSRKFSGEAGFNFLHLRIEEDWVEHCERWRQNPWGVSSDCMGDIANLGVTLKGMITDTSVPIIMSFSSDIHQEMFGLAVQSLKESNFTIVSNQALLKSKSYSREEAALVSYFLALEAQQFVGNSVSSYSALLILERRSMQKWAAYYNHGNIPLSGFLPIYKVPWILRDTCSDVIFFFSQVLPTLIQGAIVGRLDTYLFCDSQQEISKEILDATSSFASIFTVIQHSEVVREMESLGIDYSPIEHYYQIVMLPKLRQYNFIIFTNSNVWFHKQIEIELFGLPLPRFQIDYTLGGDWEVRLKLINAQYIREQKFINQINISTESGLVQDGKEKGVIKDMSDMSTVAPISCDQYNRILDKWTNIISCKEKEFQRLYGPTCQDLFALEPVQNLAK